MRKIFNNLANIIAIASAVGFATASPRLLADTQADQTFHIEAQNLADALRALGTQLGREVMFQPAQVEGRMSPKLDGRFVPEQALRLLLKGTGLRAIENGGSFVIVGSPTSQRSPEDGDAPSATLLVTGSRIKGANIAAPVIEVSQKEMRRSGQNDLGEVIRSLPQSFSGGQNPSVAPGNVGIANQNLSGGSTANLRGLGGDATLTLLNGHRLSYGSAVQAVDISAIPVSVVSRMEVIPDGASAIYGSDAVGGVVNIILKRDYEGYSTSARWGAATDGGDVEQQYNATAGIRWNSGGFIVAYDFLKGSDITARDRSYTDYMPDTATLLPERENHSLIFSGHQAIGPDLEFAVDALFNRREISSMLALDARSGYLNTPVNKSFALAPSLAWRINPDWTVNLSGLYGRDRTDYDQRYYSNGAVASRAYGCYCNVARSVELGAEGKLLSLPAGDVRLAIGGGYRYNSFEDTNASGSRSNGGGSIDSSYAFGELNVPLISPEQDLSWAYRISINGALRYERYPGIDEVATPKLGLIYAPTRDFDLKASWGKSFKAPTLLQQYQMRYVTLRAASAYGGSQFPSGSVAMMSQGGNPDLKPERAETWTITLGAHPSAIPGLQLDASYFNIRYKNRIIQPISGVNQYSALSNPIFGDYVIYAPDAATQAALIASTNGQLNNYSGAPYDPSSVVAIAFNNFINGTEQKIHGFDLSGRYSLPIGAWGELNVAGNGSWLKSTEQINENAPVTRLAGIIYNPPKFRGRFNISWTKDSFTLAGYVNHSGRLRDTRSTSENDVKSQTTFDLNALLNLPADTPLGAWDFALSARNLFNARPPYAAPSGGNSFYVNYDSTNYSPIGRFVSLSVTKHW